MQGALAGALAMGKELAPNFGQLLQVLEGPTVLRTISGLAGFALTLGCIVESLNVIQDLADPPALLLKFYTALFGLVVFANECKSGASPKVEQLRDFTFKWMPFMSVMGGKGFFMIFFGAVAFAFHSDWKVWGPGLVVGVVGVLYIVMHLVSRDSMGDAIDKSMSIQAQSLYEPINKNDYRV